MSKLSSSNLVRWGGLAAIVGGILVAILEIVETLTVRNVPARVAAPTSTFLILMSLWLVAIYLVLLALVGLYAKQMEESGSLGLVGFLVAFAGTLMMFGAYWGGAFFTPPLASLAPEFLDLLESETNAPGLLMAAYLTSVVLFHIGWFLFGLASYRAKVLQRGASLLLLVAAILMLVSEFINIPLSGVIYAIALVWLGYPVWKGAS